MDSSTKQVVRLLLFIVCYSFTALMYRPVVPLYLSSLDASPVVVGLVVAAYSVVPTLLAVWASATISAYPVRTLLGAGSLMIMVGCLTLAVSTSIPILLLGQMISGSSALLVVVSAQSYVQLVSDPAKLARNFSLLVGTFSLADVVGPAAGGFLVRSVGFQNTFLLAAACACVGVAVSRIVDSHKLVAEDAGPMTLRGVGVILSSARYRLGLVLTMAGIAILSLSMSFYPLYLSGVGLGAALVGLVISARGMGQVLAPVIMGPLLNRLGRLGVVYIALAAGIGVMMLVPFLSAFHTLVVASLVMGCSFGLIIPMSLVMVAEGGRSEDRVKALSVRFAFNRVTDTLSPVAFGVGVQQWGLGVPFFMTACYLLLTKLFVIRNRTLLSTPFPVAHAADECDH